MGVYLNNKVLIIGHDKNLIEYCLSNDVIVDNLIDRWDYEEDHKSFSDVNNRIFVDDVRHLDQVAMAFWGSSDAYDSIITSYEGGIITAGFLESFLNKRSEKFEQSFLMRNKYLQKSKIKGEVQVTKYQILNNLYNLTNEAIFLEYPIVIKPIDGYATESTFIVDSFEKLKEKSFNLNVSKKYLLEEFVSGEEYYADGYVNDGELEIFSVSKYEKPVIQIHEGYVVKAIQIHPEVNLQFYSEIKVFINKILKLLDYKNGVFHLEFFVENKQFVFSECGARPGGGMIVDCFKSLYGLDLNEIVASTQLNFEIKTPVISEESFGFAYIPAIRVDIKKLPEISDIQQHFPFVKKVIYNWKIGENQPDMKKNSMKRIGLFQVSLQKNEVSFDKLNQVIDYFKNL